MQLIAGSEQLQFRFVNNRTNPVEVRPTVVYDPTQNTLQVQGGIIQHMTLGINAITGTHALSEYKFWNVDTYTSTEPLEEEKLYWLYARVPKTSSANGTFVVTTEEMPFDTDPAYYNLLVGALNSEYEGDRSYTSLYGFTEVLPGQIIVNLIRSNDGKNYLDFVRNAFRIGNDNTYLDWNSAQDGILRLKGTIVQSPSGDEDLIGVFRGTYSSSTTYYKGDEATYTVSGATSTYRYINPNPAAGKAPTDAAYWKLVASAGKNGVDGDDGDTGAAGPMLNYVGEYSSTKTYIGTSQVSQVVKHNGSYWYTKNVGGSFSGQTPSSSSSYWTSFGANFESIATGLLFAELAFIDKLIVNRICRDAGNSSPRMLASGSEMGFYKNLSDEASIDRALIRLGIAVGIMSTDNSTKPGMVIRDKDGDNSYTEVTTEGIFSNGSNINSIPSVSGRNAAVTIAALLQKRVGGSSGANSINAAVYGWDSSSDSDASYSEGYGGYFNKLRANGMFVGCRQITSGVTLSETDVLVSCYNTSAISVQLPSNPYAGQVIFIRRNNSATVTVYGNVKSILNTGTVSSISVGEGQGDEGVFKYDGQYWLYNYTPRKPE